MAERDEEQLDFLLRDFLGETLNPKLGAAEGHFRRYIENEKRAAWRQRTWLMGAFISGIAASVAVLWASPLFKTINANPSLHIVKSNDESSAAPGVIHPVAEQVVQTRTTDEGVFLMDDNTPVRILHRQSVEETNYLDRRDGPTQTVQPKDDLVVIKLVTY